MYGTGGQVNRMSDDLISRKVAYKAFSDYLNRNFIGEVSSQIELSIGEIASVVKSIPTAFDKEKVIEELKGEIELCVTHPLYPGRYIKKDRAIEIVEKGGIE